MNFPMRALSFIYWISSLTVSDFICRRAIVLDFGTHCPILLIPWLVTSSFLVPLHPSPSLVAVWELITTFPLLFYDPKMIVCAYNNLDLPRSLPPWGGAGTITKVTAAPPLTCWATKKPPSYHSPYTCRAIFSSQMFMFSASFRHCCSVLFVFSTSEGWETSQNFAPMVSENCEYCHNGLWEAQLMEFSKPYPWQWWLTQFLL